MKNKKSERRPTPETLKDGTVHSVDGERNDTSPSLLERARGGDQFAWEQLVKLYEPLLVDWCHRSNLNDSDAADVRQEVLLAVYAGLGSFVRRKTGAFRCWLRAVTRSKICDRLRRMSPGQGEGGSDALRRLVQTPAKDPPHGPDLNDQAEASLLYRRALELIRTDFTAHTWQAFWRVVAEGQSPAHVAQDLGMSRTAVYIAKSRVLSRLRAEFEGMLDE
jgi:RNA polymerase sigma-70 factor (ECF subfamily)